MMKLSCPSPARCHRDSKDVVVKTSPRSIKTVAQQAEHSSENAAQKLSPARSKRRANLTPVSTCTALSHNICSISSPVALTQTVCNMSSQNYVVAVTQTQCSVASQVTQTNCSRSLQPCSESLKQTDSDVGPMAETTDTTDSSVLNSEIVAYTHSTDSVSGQWQGPCGVPLAPFIIAGMYPMMGSGYGCQMMSLPPLVSPTMPAATAVISARAGSILSSPLPRYSGYLPLPAAAPVVPLYMSPVVGPLMQPGSSSSQLNLMPFVPSLPHAAATAFHNQRSSATVILRPSMLPADQLYTASCMLSPLQQVNLIVWSVSFTLF